MIGLKRLTIWRLERKGDFPKRLQLTGGGGGGGAVGWLEHEVEEWIKNRPTVRR